MMVESGYNTFGHDVFANLVSDAAPQDGDSALHSMRVEIGEDGVVKVVTDERMPARPGEFAGFGVADGEDP